jgi:hypothetical protein
MIKKTKQQNPFFDARACARLKNNTNPNNKTPPLDTLISVLEVWFPY